VGRSALLSAAIAVGSALLLLITLRTRKDKPGATWVLATGGLWWLAYFVFVLVTIILPHH